MTCCPRGSFLLKWGCDLQNLAVCQLRLHTKYVLLLCMTLLPHLHDELTGLFSPFYPQLLTNIFQHICITIISDPHFSKASGSVVTERDLQALERCNQENTKALEEICGVDGEGSKAYSATEKELRSAGDLWAEHILENAKGVFF